MTSVISVTVEAENSADLPKLVEDLKQLAKLTHGAVHHRGVAGAHHCQGW